jgi:hypothetical protein
MCSSLTGPRVERLRAGRARDPPVDAPGVDALLVLPQETAIISAREHPTIYLLAWNAARVPDRGSLAA